MRTRSYAASVLAVAGLSLAPSAAMAHPGHESCAAGAQAFTVPLAQSGQAGAVISQEGRNGTAAETGAGLHAAGCDPR